MNKHLLWLWLWYFIGALLYMVKRAFYLITGPNPVAENVGQFVKVAGIPLLFRFAVDSGLFWLCFKPQLLSKGLSLLGWESFSWVVLMVTQFAPMAFFAGLGSDPITDWGIGTIFPKIPVLKEFWPQMPPPLPKPAN